MNKQHFDFVSNTIFKLKPNESLEVTLHSDLTNDLFMDSIQLLGLCTEIENHYKIFLPDDFEEPPKTIEDILKLIQQGLKNENV